MVFDQSCGTEAVGHLEGMLKAAHEHEKRIIAEEIANGFYERINQLQRIIDDLQNKPRNATALKGGNIIEAEFTQITDQRGRHG